MNAAPASRTDHSVRLVAALSAMVALALLLCILWAASASNVLNALRFLAGDRWGIVTLLDVYAGALVVAIWMWVRERRFATWALWVLALLCLGHFVSLVYLLVRTLHSRALPEVFAPRCMPARGGPHSNSPPNCGDDDKRHRESTNTLT